jgi:hypothetical protein
MPNEAAISIGTAYQITIDNFYDLIKRQTGNWQTDSLFQLKLISQTIDVSDKYPCYSYENLRQKADLQIENAPIVGNLSTGATQFTRVWGDFLYDLYKCVPKPNLSSEDVQKLNELHSDVIKLQEEILKLQKLEKQNWSEYCAVTGISEDNMEAFFNFHMSSQGQAQEINGRYLKIDDDWGLINSIEISGTTQSDKDIITAWNNYSNVRFRQLLPKWPSKITFDELNALIQQASARFSFELAFPFDKSINTIKTEAANSLLGSFTSQTQNTTTITTDWGGSSSVSFPLVKINNNVGDSTSIQDEFNKVTGVEITSKSLMQIGISYAAWFDASLFKSEYVTKYPNKFFKYFEPNGSLLYYPISLVVMRGVSLTFTSSQNWTYDYHKKFSASVGGGFSVFGISFGGSANYQNDVKEHKFEASGTKLTISDDENTIRLLGYEIAHNHEIQNKIINSKTRFL